VLKKSVLAFSTSLAKNVPSKLPMALRSRNQALSAHAKSVRLGAGHPWPGTSRLVASRLVERVFQPRASCAKLKCRECSNGDPIIRAVFLFEVVPENPMKMSMYEASIPLFLHTLENLKGILQKGAAHAEAKKFDASNLVTSRLAPDMLNLARQVQIASDAAKATAMRLSASEPLKLEDNETTFPELVARVDKTINYL
jgi:hypothetical protein